MNDISADIAVSVQEITKAFTKVIAVRDLSFSIRRGSIFGLIGPNGAGKTTAIRLLTGIARPTTGTIQILGTHTPAEVRHRIGYLPEEKGLYKKMRVRDYLIYIARLKDLTRKDAQSRADRLLERMNLVEWGAEPCGKLSKGMGQKVQVMATLIHDPDLIVLDEPFSGLDPMNLELVRNLILEMRDSGRTVVLSTHVMEQAQQLCEELLLVNEGQAILKGPLVEILRGYGNTVQVDYQGHGAEFNDLPGVLRVNDAGQSAELTLAEGADRKAFLRQLIEQVDIQRIDFTQTSLHEVFVREVGRLEEKREGANG